MEELEQKRRLWLLGYGLAAILLLLAGRLLWLQLWQGRQYRELADANFTRRLLVQAPRGNLYDRNGVLLVGSKPSFAVSVVPGAFIGGRPEAARLGRIIGLTAEEIESRLAAAGEEIYRPLPLRRGADEAILTQIQEQREYLPGVGIEALPVRHYVYNDLAAQTLGYIGRINEEEYQQHQGQGYDINDLIGKDGLELAWEKELRGHSGSWQVAVDASGSDVKELGKKRPEAGQDLVLTLEVNLQRLTEGVLAQQIAASRAAGEPAGGGCALVLDAHTGGILALASYPGFDPNAFAAGISTAAWRKLSADRRQPLGNKAVQSEYPPGSVFKVITAAGALHRQLTTPQEVFYDQGFYTVEGWRFYGWETKGLGRLTLPQALAWSSDPVFYELGQRLGVDNLASYALTFGLGRSSGLKLPGEVAGLVPTAAWKEAVYGERWYAGESSIAAIGQGYYLVTPLQQALMMMAVANSGTIYQPRLVNRLLGSDGRLITEYEPSVLQQVYLPPEIWQVLQQGLGQVTETGTASAVFRGCRIKTAGKTGSAETGKGTVHSWFAGYAPADMPEIVIAVLVEEGGEGASAAAPAARQIIEGYFNGKIVANVGNTTFAAGNMVRYKEGL